MGYLSLLAGSDATEGIGVVVICIMVMFWGVRFLGDWDGKKALRT